MTGLPSVGSIIGGKLIVAALLFIAAGAFGIWMGRCSIETYVTVLQWCSYIGGIITLIVGVIYFAIGIKVLSR